MTHGHSTVSLRIRSGKDEAALRCYVPRLSTIAGLLAVGFFALQPAASRVSDGMGLATDIVILIAGCLFATVLTVVGATVIRQRRAAAGACHTCSHPCRQEAGLDAPRWPHRPLTRAALPVIVIPRQSLPAEEEMIRATAAGTADR
jgi:hypothetical protein